MSFAPKYGGKVVVAFLGTAGVVSCALLLFSQSKPVSQTQAAKTATQSSTAAAQLSDAQMARMSSDELAKYVFDHHGCNNCHTFGANGKLGFTERGKQVGKGFEGCIALL